MRAAGATPCRPAGPGSAARQRGDRRAVLRRRVARARSGAGGTVDAAGQGRVGVVDRPVEHGDGDAAAVARQARGDRPDGVAERRRDGLRDGGRHQLAHGIDAEHGLLAHEARALVAAHGRDDGVDRAREALLDGQLDAAVRDLREGAILRRLRGLGGGVGADRARPRGSGLGPQHHDHARVGLGDAGAGGDVRPRAHGLAADAAGRVGDRSRGDQHRDHEHGLTGAGAPPGSIPRLHLYRLCHEVGSGMSVDCQIPRERDRCEVLGGGGDHRGVVAAVGQRGAAQLRARAARSPGRGTRAARCWRPRRRRRRGAGSRSARGPTARSTRLRARWRAGRRPPGRRDRVQRARRS